MVAVGQYMEWYETKNKKKHSSFHLNVKYNSIIKYYEDLINGKILDGIIPYNVIITERIISCEYKYRHIHVLLIASIKNKVYDRESR